MTPACWVCPTCETEHTDLQWLKCTLLGWAGGTSAVQLTAVADDDGVNRLQSRRVFIAVEIRRCRECDSPMGREAQLPMAGER